MPRGAAFGAIVARQPAMITYTPAQVEKTAAFAWDALGVDNAGAAFPDEHNRLQFLEPLLQTDRVVAWARISRPNEEVRNYAYSA